MDEELITLPLAPEIFEMILIRLDTRSMYQALDALPYYKFLTESETFWRKKFYHDLGEDPYGYIEQITEGLNWYDRWRSISIQIQVQVDCIFEKIYSAGMIGERVNADSNVIADFLVKSFLREKLTSNVYSFMSRLARKGVNEDNAGPFASLLRDPISLGNNIYLMHILIDPYLFSDTLYDSRFENINNQEDEMRSAIQFFGKTRQEFLDLVMKEFESYIRARLNQRGGRPDNYNIAKQYTDNPKGRIKFQITTI